MTIKLEINVDNANDLKKDIISLASLLAAVDTADAVVTKVTPATPVEVHEALTGVTPVVEATPVAPVAPEATGKAKRAAKRAAVKTEASTETVVVEAVKELANVVPATPQVTPMEVLNTPAPAMNFSSLGLGIPVAPPATPIFATPSALAPEMPVPVAPPAHEVAKAVAEAPHHNDIMKLFETFDMGDKIQMKRLLAVFEMHTTVKNKFDAVGNIELDTNNITPENALKFIDHANGIRNWIVTGK